MSRLEELIQQYCPDGVEYMKLGEIESNGIIKLGRGNVISKQDIKECPGDFPVYSSSSVGDGEIGRYGKYMFDDERISWSIDGGGKFFYRNNLKYSITNVSGWLKVLDPKTVSTKYLYYSLMNEWVKKVYDYTHKAHPSVIREEYEIPVPPLPVQEEIVRILDSFTELQAELQAELQKRTQQYAYYKDKLLSGDYPTMKIGDITRVFSASRVHKNEWKTSGVPFYRSSDVMSFHRGEKNTRGEVFISEELFEKLSAKSGRIKIGDLLVTGGGSIGVPYIVNFEPLYVKDADLLCIVKNDILDNRFLYHYMRSEKFKDYLSSITHDATIAHYTISQIKETPVPVPTWDEQQRIITILDKFDTLINDLSQGLPAEIEARRKQYEYYRDQLLTFKQKA